MLSPLHVALQGLVPGQVEVKNLALQGFTVVNPPEEVERPVGVARRQRRRRDNDNDVLMFLMR